MQIVYASNDGYARHLGTSMASLLDRNRETASIDIYVLALELSKENENHLGNLAQKYGREIHIIQVGNLAERFGGTLDTGGYDSSIMLRLLMGELLPGQLERVLYLDCDTVVLQSLGRLWNTNLQGKLMGAVMEPTIYPEVKASIGLTREEPYFNSGVLLVDLKQWRETGVQERLLEFYREKGGKLFASDQDLLNGALKGRIFSLSPRYNFFTNYRYFSYRELVKLSPSYKQITRRQLKTARRHPAVLHYMGDERPWMAGNWNHYRRAYEIYLGETPWAGTPKQTGREWFLLAYHMMEYLTVVCPAARRWISRSFGMKLVEGRKKAAQKAGKSRDTADGTPKE